MVGNWSKREGKILSQQQIGHPRMHGMKCVILIPQAGQFDCGGWRIGHFTLTTLPKFGSHILEHQANSVLRLMVQGRGHPMMGSGQTRVRLGRGPITYLPGKPFGSWKLIETGKSFYVEIKRSVKLVLIQPTISHTSDRQGWAWQICWDSQTVWPTAPNQEGCLNDPGPEKCL